MLLLPVLCVCLSFSPLGAPFGSSIIMKPQMSMKSLKPAVTLRILRRYLKRF